jgi:hypothetical protein
VVSRTPSEIGPIRSRRQAELAARALAGASDAELENLLGLGGPLPRLRSKLRDLSDSQRFEDAARLRDRIKALEGLVRHLRRLQQLRSLELCLLAPAVEPGMRRAFFLSGGRIQAARTVPPGAGAALELEAGFAAARARALELDAESVDELLLVASFLQRPPAELEIRPLASCRTRRAA